MRDCLVVARVGDRSLHENWISGSRDWDLALSCFGSHPPAGAAECVLVEHTLGPKWRPLHDLIDRDRQLVERYRFVMFPDDDLMFSAADANRFFAICRAQGFAIAQPSLDLRSYYSHPITVRRPLLSYRVTDFVEVMAPCFRQDILQDLLPTLLASPSGWGLDHVWSQVLAGRSERMAIVDEVSVTHTRPVGGELYRGAGLQRTPLNDLGDLHARGEAGTSQRMFYGVSRSGWRVPRAAVRALGLITRLSRRHDGSAKTPSLTAEPASNNPPPAPVNAQHHGSRL